MPKKLEKDKLLIKWNFDKNLKHQKPIRLREIVGNKSKFKKYIFQKSKDFFDF